MRLRVNFQGADGEAEMLIVTNADEPELTETTVRIAGTAQNGHRAGEQIEIIFPRERIANIEISDRLAGRR